MTRESGLTLIELLAVLALLGITVAIATVRMKSLASPLDEATSLIEGTFREARLNAIATISSYRVTPVSSTSLRADRGSSCSGTTWTQDTKMSMSMPSSVTLSPSSWSVCFSSRGISTNNVTITVQHPTYGSRRVEVLLGGTTRVLR